MSSVLQDVLPALYRGHDALLFTSRYEAWGMPVLEGMASGLPVVATSCLGVQTFAQHGVNALLADPQVLCASLAAVARLSIKQTNEELCDCLFSYCAHARCMFCETSTRQMARPLASRGKS